jgi:SUKH-4 immunity protein of toxin-antitoxin system
VQPDAWARDWYHPLICGRSDERRMPVAAREFLASFGLPRVIIFEWRNAFELSFAPLGKELVPYNAEIGWGDFYDEARDREWSHHLVVGEEEFCNGHAAICIHKHDGTVNRLDCELDKKPKCFVNSNVELFGMSLLLAQKWSAAVHFKGALPSRGSFEALASELMRADPHAFADQSSYWPSLIECVLENPDGDPLELEITSDPARSKPRF